MGDFELFFDLSLDCMAICDLERGHFLRVNQALAETLGYSREELCSTPFIEFVHPNDRTDTDQVRLALCESDPVVTNFTNRYLTREGKVIWFSWHAKHVEKNKTFAVARNIDATKHYEEELRQQVQTFMDANNTKLNFIKETCHELKNALNPISILTHLTEKETESCQRQAYLQAIQVSVETATRLIRDLESIKELGEHGLEIDNEYFNLRAVTRNCLDRFRGESISLEEHADYIIYGNKHRLKQIMSNYITNGLKFGQKKPLTIKVEEESGKLKIHVIDQGIGIPKNQQNLLFRPYQRLCNAVRYPGTGLGLSICQKLAEKMKMKVDCDSQEGNGSDFWIETSHYQAISGGT
jgi:PAS domain S-box-containing protein